MSVNKFKVGDVVKCVDNGVYTSITKGKEYDVVKLRGDDTVVVRDNIGEESAYYSYRFELCDNPKFKDGDMVYLIGFDSLKPHKLLSTGDNYLTMKFRVIIDDDNSKTFTENGHYTNADTTPSIVLATEENRLMLNKLLGVEYEPVKLTGSDLAKKLLKDKPQTCWISDVSDDSRIGVTLIMKFENDMFISKSGTGWKFAVPCNQHGDVLEDE